MGLDRPQSVHCTFSVGLSPAVYRYSHRRCTQVGCYHAGKNNDVRTRVQRDWSSGGTNVVGGGWAALHAGCPIRRPVPVLLKQYPCITSCNLLGDM